MAVRVDSILIEAVMVEMSPNGPQHVEVIQALGELLPAAAHGHELQVRVQRR